MIVTGAALSVALLAAVLLQVMVSFSKSEDEQIRAQIVDLTSMEIGYVRTKMADIRSWGQGLATSVAQFEDITGPEAERLVRAVKDSPEVTDIFLTLTDGSMYFSDETGFEIASKMGFGRNRAGEVFFSEVYTLRDGRDVFAMTVPVTRDGAVAGILTYVYETALLAQLIDITCFDDQGYLHIFQSEDGRFVARSVRAAGRENDMSFFDIEKADFREGYSFDELRENIRNGRSGFAAYSLYGGGYFAYYAPVEEFGWSVVTVVPEEVSRYYAEMDSRNSILLAIGVASAVMVLLGTVVMDIRRRQRRLRGAVDQLNLSDKRFRVAISHVSHLVFGYDFSTRLITILTDQDELKSLVSGRRELSLEMFRSLAFSEDQGEIDRLFSEIRAGFHENTAAVRMHRDDEEDCRWYHLVLTGIADAKGRVVQAVGTLEDINDQRTETLRLRERADTDPLTGIYNRAATERMVNGIIADGDPGAKHAFLVIDLDRFKNINDDCGHLYGDEVLKRVADTLSSAFRSSDITGRLGGDEFGVFLEGVSNAEIIRRKLRKPLAALAKPAAPGKPGVTLSIGVAFGGGSDNFVELYRRGDAALYDAKQHRNCICEYRAEEEK